MQVIVLMLGKWNSGDETMKMNSFNLQTISVSGKILIVSMRTNFFFQSAFAPPPSG